MAVIFLDCAYSMRALTGFLLSAAKFSPVRAASADVPDGPGTGADTGRLGHVNTNHCRC